MNRNAVIALGALLVIAVAAYAFLRAGGGNRLSAAPLSELLDQLAHAASEPERDALVAALAAHGEGVIEPLLTRYPREPAESQLKINTSAILTRLPRPLAIEALRRLAKIETDAAARDAIHGQIHMLEKSAAPPEGG